MKRVYREVTTRPAADGWGIALDGRPTRTPGIGKGICFTFFDVGLGGLNLWLMLKSLK